MGDLRHQRQSGGSDHNPGPDGVVQAIDLTASGQTGLALAAAALATLKARGQKGYVIHQGRIANPSVQGGAWRTYRGANPHNHHVHVSVHTMVDTTKAWLLGDKSGAIVKPPPIPKRTRGPYPLPRGHWFGPKSADPKNHSGYSPKDRPGVQQIQATVGAKVDGQYGEDTKCKVAAWQKAHKLKSDGYVGPATWEAMH